MAYLLWSSFSVHGFIRVCSCWFTCLLAGGFRNFLDDEEGHVSSEGFPWVLKQLSLTSSPHHFPAKAIANRKKYQHSCVSTL